jgi:hypothetical protein
LQDGGPLSGRIGECARDAAAIGVAGTLALPAHAVSAAPSAQQVAMAMCHRAIFNMMGITAVTLSRTSREVPEMCQGAAISRARLHARL